MSGPARWHQHCRRHGFAAAILELHDGAAILVGAAWCVVLFVFLAFSFLTLKSEEAT